MKLVGLGIAAAGGIVHATWYLHERNALETDDPAAYDAHVTAYKASRIRSSAATSTVAIRSATSSVMAAWARSIAARHRPAAIHQHEPARAALRARVGAAAADAGSATCIEK